MADGHQRIRERTERKFRAALERLEKGAGTHPKHRGRNVPITVATVAREAQVGRTTVYRFPHLIEEVVKARGAPRVAVQPSGRAERRLRQAGTVRELQRQVLELLDRNLELTILVAKLDPAFEKKLIPMARAAGVRPRT